MTFLARLQTIKGHIKSNPSQNSMIQNSEENFPQESPKVAGKDYLSQGDPQHSLQVNKKFIPNEKQANIANKTSQNKLISQKIPKNVKIFLLNRRAVTDISQNRKKQHQKPKKIKQTVHNILNITEDKMLQESMAQLQTKNTQFFRDLKENGQKNLGRIVHPQISIKCSICQGMIEEAMVKNLLFNCQHIFCSDCTKNYILYKIDRFELIYCPNQNCKEKLETSSHFYSDEISLKERKRYKKIQKFYKVYNKNEKMCPKQQCEGLIEFDIKKQALVCNVCSEQYCSKCISKVHEGECRDYETSFMIKSLNLVQCEKCKNFIQKTEGCHHITCKCGFEFCEKCKQIWQKKHICRYSMLKNTQGGWGGCDWGLTTKDHIYFLLKIPLKIMLLVLGTLFWVMFSFLGTPLNLMIFCYWLYLVFVKPSINMICEETKCWKIILEVVFFPFFMVKNICVGGEYLMTHLDHLLPQLPNTYRWIIRL